MDEWMLAADFSSLIDVACPSISKLMPSNLKSISSSLVAKSVTLLALLDTQGQNG
jgi:hypothetical protein